MNNATEHSLVLIDEFGKGTNSVRVEENEEKLRGGGMEEDEGREQETDLREGRRMHTQREEARAATEGHSRPGSALSPLPFDRWMVWHFWLLCSVTG